MATIQDAFNKLCTNIDFIEVYNDQTGQEVTRLTLPQLFSTGSMFHIIEVITASGDVLRLTDGYFDLDYNGFTYLASGDFLDISSNSEEKEINNNGITVNVSNVREEYITLIRNKQFDKSDVKIEMVFLNPNTGKVETTYPVFRGVVDNINISIDYKDKECTNESEFQLNSIWEVLDKNARSHASDGIHRSYPGNENDLFFSRAGRWNAESKWHSSKK
ncbi:DUF2163 domain-containing protein [Escherichia coli]|uniref:DUF2163 domain-containing protein n=1 Tax=Escherichia coli TaxID=562 RepID=UPI0006A549B5|nr:DUF2163 domain-containing protein [Escherichia coli]MBW8690628.1 DUF2163 domain-containing protein [Escherichia coli]MDA6081021.1 DUF2163 domain-containing protein [Escherichia coli]CUA37363.1 Uncharacterised protein [Escherichia coli]